MSGQARLLDSEKLRDQLTGLERRFYASGRETVDDSGAQSSHDDLANVCCGTLVNLSFEPYIAPQPHFGTYGRCSESNHLGQVGGYSNAQAYGNNHSVDNAAYGDAPSEFWRMIGDLNQQ
jgi:hypothetical protein